MLAPAFFNIDSMELVIVVVIALLLFGERLPEVAKSVGRGFMEFRKSLQDLRSQSGIDDAIRKFKDEIQVPEGVRNPRRFVEDTVRQAISETEEPPKEPEQTPAQPPEQMAAESPPVVIEPPAATSPFEAELGTPADKPVEPRPPQQTGTS